MFTLDDGIKREEEVVDLCESTASTYDMDDYYERSMAYKAGECAKEHKQIAEWLKQLKRLKEQEPILDKIRAEIEKLEVIDSIYSYEGHDWAAGMKSDVLDIIDKYREIIWKDINL